MVLVGHSYSGVPVAEVAAAGEDVTHVVYVCAFAMPAGTSMLDALGGQPREWWIFAEDGESIMPDYPGPLLYGECNPSCGERRDRETASALGALGSRATARPDTGRNPPRTGSASGTRSSPQTWQKGSRTRAGHDHFPALPPPDAQPPRRAGSHVGWNRRANRPRSTGRVLIRRFVLTGRAGVDARGQARYGADLQGVGDSWSGTG